jgi:hypothetical protein
MEDDLNPRQMGDKLISFKNIKEHQKFQKWKTTSKMGKKEGDLIYQKWKTIKKTFLDFSQM